MRTRHGRFVKNKRILKKDFKKLVKLNMRPREIVIPSGENEQKTAEFLYDLGASALRRIKRKRK